MKRLLFTLSATALVVFAALAVTTEVITINPTPLIPVQIGSDLVARTYKFSGRKGTTNNTGTVYILQNTNEVGQPLLPGQAWSLTVGSFSRTFDWYVRVVSTNDGVTLNLYQ